MCRSMSACFYCGCADTLIGVTQRQVEAVRQAGVDRLLVVGVAGGLEVAPGVLLSGRRSP